jgi:ABC-type bacteriocin/lantibiotic exporter with double-glycine peptidase domain
MRKFLVFLSIFWATPAPAVVQIPIALEQRCSNDTGVQCVWASLETLARYHQIRAASDLREHYKGPADHNDVQRALNARGVTWQMTYAQSVPFLKQCCDRGWGAAVSLRRRHMVTCVGYNTGHVYLIDNSDPNLDIREYSETEFLQMWDGWTVTLPPKAQTWSLLYVAPRMAR